MPNTILMSKKTDAIGTNKMDEPKPLTVPIISAIKASNIKIIYSSIVFKPLQDNKFELKC